MCAEKAVLGQRGGGLFLLQVCLGPGRKTSELLYYVFHFSQEAGVDPKYSHVFLWSMMHSLGVRLL